MNYLISVLPIVLYILLIKGMDGFSLSRWEKITECFVWGILTCIMCFFLGRQLEFRNEFPIVEELIKGAPLVVAVYKNRSAFFAETLIYGAAVGAGFSLLENIFYAWMSTDFTLGDSLIRGIGTSLLHIGCTALLASMTLVFSRIAKNKSMTVKIVLGIAALLPSIIIHFVYNMFLLPEFFQVLLTVVIYIGLFMLIYSIDEKLIHKWLDLCISNDITLYTSMKQGKLQTTNAGQYLLMAKERFQPEVFFDICVFLGLYLEISIAAKSRMIMKESGLDLPLSEEEHKANAAKITELKSLRKNIGTSGVLLLSPFVNFKATDEWAMNELL